MSLTQQLLKVISFITCKFLILYFMSVKNSSFSIDNSFENNNYLVEGNVNKPEY